jgi:hypothetical protein
LSTLYGLPLSIATVNTESGIHALGQVHDPCIHCSSLHACSKPNSLKLKVGWFEIEVFLSPPYIGVFNFTFKTPISKHPQRDFGLEAKLAKIKSWVIWNWGFLSTPNVGVSNPTFKTPISKHPQRAFGLEAKLAKIKSWVIWNWGFFKSRLRWDVEFHFQNPNFKTPTKRFCLEA